LPPPPASAEAEAEQRLEDAPRFLANSVAEVRRQVEATGVQID